MIKGYIVFQKRLEYLEKTVKLIDIVGRTETELKGTEAQGIINIIHNYRMEFQIISTYITKYRMKGCDKE